MISVFNTRDMFNTIYGYMPEEIKFKPENVHKRSSGKFGPYYEKDSLGRDVFMPLHLGDLFLPYVWISVQLSDTIIETGMTERGGTVKELVCENDIEFDVKGLLIGHNGAFPEDDLVALNELFKKGKKQSVTCKSVLTDIFLLSNGQGAQDKVVIYQPKISDNKGIEHVRGFEFTLKSDRDFELTIS